MFFRYLLFVFLFACLAGCTKIYERVENEHDSFPHQAGTEDDAASSQVDTFGAPDTTGIQTQALDISESDPQFFSPLGVGSEGKRQSNFYGDSAPPERTIYFGYDNSVIEDSYLDLLEQEATYLKQHPEATLRLEGHTDERGSREYNLALGDRRSRAVYQRLILLGVTRSQLQIVSYGEERPLFYGMNEASWSKNRRVELVR